AGGQIFRPSVDCTADVRIVIKVGQGCGPAGRCNGRREIIRAAELELIAGTISHLVCLSVVACSTRRSEMKWMLIPAALAFALTTGVISGSANAAGCVKGAVVGGAAGHLAGHHGAAGAGAGCVIGHHEANKQSREQPTQNNPGSGSSTAPADNTRNK
ncbi:MAG TPA: hypothetical protein VE687_00960, partial [Stellaceae bacterium]|nr:hypothetical protein [Stellaceae bacterium]